MPEIDPLEEIIARDWVVPARILPTQIYPPDDPTDTPEFEGYVDTIKAAAERQLARTPAADLYDRAAEQFPQFVATVAGMHLKRLLQRDDRFLSDDEKSLVAGLRALAQREAYEDDKALAAKRS